MNDKVGLMHSFDLLLHVYLHEHDEAAVVVLSLNLPRYEGCFLLMAEKNARDDVADVHQGIIDVHDSPELQNLCPAWTSWMK